MFLSEQIITESSAYKITSELHEFGRSVKETETKIVLERSLVQYQSHLDLSSKNIQVSTNRRQMQQIYFRI